MRKKTRSMQAKMVECLLLKQIRFLKVVLFSFLEGSLNSQFLHSFRIACTTFVLHCCLRNLFLCLMKKPFSSFCQPAAIWQSSLVFQFSFLQS